MKNISRDYYPSLTHSHFLLINYLVPWLTFINDLNILEPSRETVTTQTQTDWCVTSYTDAHNPRNLKLANNRTKQICDGDSEYLISSLISDGYMKIGHWIFLT